MGAKKKVGLKKSSSKEFNKLVNQSAATKLPPRRSESTFTCKFVFLSVLWILRILVVLLPQYGYVQPDEFFQFTEPIAGDVFGLEHYRAWEFHPAAPLRNMFFPAFFSLPIFQFLKNLFNDSISPYLLLVGPRLLMALASFLTDFCVYRLCRLLYAPGPSCKSPLSAKTIDCLLAHASSYLAFTYYTHTFSNTIETILFGLLLVAIVESLRQQNDHIWTNIKISFLMAFGFFNRPTFTVFALVPVLYWLATYSTLNPSKASAKSTRISWNPWLCSCFRNMMVNSINLLIPFTLAATLLILLDTYYHRGFDDLFIAVSELSIIKLAESLVLTPINFLVYNLQTKNLVNHGLHPIWFHATVCMPWCFTILAAIFYLDLILKLKSQITSKPRVAVTNPTSTVLFLCIIVSLIIFSLRPHQEPRFLLPLVIPIVCLFGHRLFNFRIISLIWFITNIILVIFYANVHQSGVVPCLLHLQSTIVKNESFSSSASVTSLIFARQYLPPRHLLTISKQQTYRFQIHDLSILDFPSSFEEHLASINPNSSIYLTIPSCLTNKLNRSLASHFPNINSSLIYHHFPHFSAEDLIDSLNTFTAVHGNSRLSIWSVWSRLHQAFSMNIWKLTFKPASLGSS